MKKRFHCHHCATQEALLYSSETKKWQKIDQLPVLDKEDPASEEDCVF